MEILNIFFKLFDYSFFIIAVFFFLFSFYQKQYVSWVQSFGEKKARKMLIFIRYIAPPILILCGLGQLIL